MSWRMAMIKARKEAAKPPPGAMTMEQIAEEMELSRERARKEVVRLIKLGRAESIPGHMVTEGGQMLPTMYYRLLSGDPPKVLQTPKKK